MLQTSCGNFRPAQKLPKMAISGLLTIYEQQKVATSSNFSIAYNLIWQFLSRPKITKTGHCSKNWQLLFCFEQPQDGVQSYQFWQ